MIFCKIISDQVCEECLKPIKEGEECLRFYNRGRIRFRHLYCQYNVRGRKTSFEEWIETIKFMSNMQVINRIRKRAIKLNDSEKIKVYVEKRIEEWKRHKKALEKLEVLNQLQV